MTIDPCSPEAFEALYVTDADPWSFASSPYETGRYQAILGLLDHRRYGRAYEPACSVGVLTERLAPHCDQLLAVDVSATAVARTAERCDHLPGVDVRTGSIVDAPPPDLDLIVMSEVGYYFEPALLDDITASLASALVSGGLFVACHWRGHSDDHRLSGAEVHRRLRASLDARLRPQGVRIEPGYLLESWVAP